MKKIAICLLVCIGIWIEVGPPSHTTAAAQSTTPPRDHSTAPDLMMVQGRLSMQVPKQPLRLGEENAIRVTLRGPAVEQILASQSQGDGYGHDVEIEGSEQVLLAQHGPDGSSWVVNVVPAALGPITIDLMANFSDGGFERESVKAEVIATRPPEKLTTELQGGLTLSRIAMDLSKEWRKRRVFLRATWPGVANPLNIPAKDLRFSVIFDKGHPAIRFDPATGEIDALRLGNALIQARYRGLTQAICVQVREDVDFGGFPKCTELEEGADRVLTTGDFGDTPGADSKLPYTAHDRRKGRFIADDRVEIAPLTHPLNVAEENAIELKVRGPAVARIECDTESRGCVPRDGYNKPSPDFTFEQKPGGLVSVNVFPTKTGPTNFSFLILFSDGGAALKTVSADVQFGAKNPRSIGTSCGNESAPNPNLPLRLGMPSSANDVWIGACYDGIAGPVILPYQVVQYRVLSQEPTPPVQLNDKTGQLTALREGQALLEAEFKGATHTTCVVVVPNEQFNDPDVSNCRGLRARYQAPLPDLPPPPKQPRAVGPGAEAALQELAREQAITRATLSPDVKDPFNADDRLQVVTSGINAVPGQPISLPLQLQGPDVLAVTMMQTFTKYFGASHAPVTYRDSERNPVTRDADGTLRVKVVPLRAGTAEFSIRVLFADGGVATRRFEIPARPPADQPARLFNALENESQLPVAPATTLHLLMKTPDNARTLFPYVTWGENGIPIALDPHDVEFSVKSDGDTPVVRLDTATGTMTALRIGQALVTMRYAGAHTNTCGVVMRDLTLGDPSDCESLRPGN